MRGCRYFAVEAHLRERQGVRGPPTLRTGRRTAGASPNATISTGRRHAFGRGRGTCRDRDDGDHGLIGRLGERG